MKIVFTILIGFVVLIAALLFASFSMCAVGSGIPFGTRATLLFIALASLAVMIGGVYLIARINRNEDSPE
jgi:hypothetical protein